jgi:hypothetical protein
VTVTYLRNLTADQLALAQLASAIILTQGK